MLPNSSKPKSRAPLKKDGGDGGDEGDGGEEEDQHYYTSNKAERCHETRYTYSVAYCTRCGQHASLSVVKHIDVPCAVSSNVKDDDATIGTARALVVGSDVSCPA